MNTTKNAYINEECLFFPPIIIEYRPNLYLTKDSVVQAIHEYCNILLALCIYMETVNHLVDIHVSASCPYGTLGTANSGHGEFHLVISILIYSCLFNVKESASVII